MKGVHGMSFTVTITPKVILIVISILVFVLALRLFKYWRDENSIGDDPGGAGGGSMFFLVKPIYMTLFLLAGTLFVSALLGVLG